MIRALPGILVVALVLLFASACRKDTLITDSGAKLELSVDTVEFDTVFTSVGSITNFLKVFNPHKQPIEISKISLRSGSDSYYRLNVDGAPGNVHENVIIPAEDSIWMFVEVTIDPGNVNNPFIVEDDIVFVTNGNEQTVKLVAWGQDAYFYGYNDFIAGLPPLHRFEDCDLLLTNDKPHVFYAWGFVESGCRLRIEEGARIHFHKNAGMWVYPGGTFQAQGTVENPIIFDGDRLEEDFEDTPGQWDRIWINQGSLDNIIENAVIRNGFIGLQTEPFVFLAAAESKLTLNNVLIENMSGLGMLARDYTIEATNLGVFNCGNQLLALTTGGDYDFRHCTFGNYWSHESRDQASIFLSNWTVDTNNAEVASDFDAFFGNCIIHGQLDEELEFDGLEGAEFNYLFDHCVVKTELPTSNADHYNSIIRNPADLEIDGQLVNPVFEDAREGKYRLPATSIAINAGDVAITGSIATDIEGNPRDSEPDLGAFEHQ